MLKGNGRNIRNFYLLQYCIVLSILIFGSGYSVVSGFHAHVARMEVELVREANITNNQIDSILVDSSKIIDVELQKFRQALNNGKLSSQFAHEILHTENNFFSVNIANRVDALSIYLDEQGLMRATSNEVITEHDDKFDEPYFQNLKENPTLPFSIGTLSISKKTNISSFYIAKSILDKSGIFRGVISQRILSQPFADNLRSSLDGIVDAQIITHTKNCEVIFLYPDPGEATDSDRKRCIYIREKITKAKTTLSTIEVPALQSLLEDSYVGYSESNKFHLLSYVTLSKKLVLLDFIRINAALFIYIILAIFAITFIMWRFYLKALDIIKSHTQSYTDPLTLLANRRALDAEYPVLWKNTIRSKEPISVLFIDIDHFKVFNDTYGHQRGDVVLQVVADTIRKWALRPLDMCCRWGGEEFVLVLPNTDEHGAVILANKIMDDTRALRFDFLDHGGPQITVSIGIASLEPDAVDEKVDLIGMADKAMYVAKQSGRDRYCLFRDIANSG